MSNTPSSSFLPDFALLRLRDVLRLFPVGRSTWLAGVQSGRYPAPVRLSPRTVGWRLADIRALIEAAGQEAARHEE